jgi:hypothetical protein
MRTKWSRSRQSGLLIATLCTSSTTTTVPNLLQKEHADKVEQVQDSLHRLHAKRPTNACNGGLLMHAKIYVS